ncbi:MAG: lysine biosynthesis protein LysW [Phycisphaerales bacterium]|nr:MAG: lysine biosynthesis protein LysW [Phycisphaerales bacterium]
MPAEPDARERDASSAHTAECPECACEVALRVGARPHEIVRCASCGGELEIVGLNPPRLEVAPEVEEDWGE